ncbi:hypothetical protein B0A48_08375 [Cryoendolithus antarcticus]|uniref:Uncharacterized protein n=1 Tax=Cryoendolithus antarcticus TaxID=1507870 RepID=A0A1V8T5G9_9PEZI|nr:hypothetical protein B0A48_08375 [Cryoendolithus antarcticus]
MPAEVAKLGSTVIAYLMEHKDTMQNFGEMVALSFVDHKNHQLFLRLVQFTKSGVYTLFSTDASALFVLRRNNAQERYVPKKHEGSSYCSTDGTFALFTEEVGVFLFSIELGQKDLQEYSARNIMSRYPLHTREMLYFIDTLTRRKLDLAAIGVELAAALRTLLEILRIFVRPKDEMIAILDGMDDPTIERLIRTCNPSVITTPPNVAGMLDAFVKAQLIPKDVLSQAHGLRASSSNVNPNTAATP